MFAPDVRNTAEPAPPVVVSAEAEAEAETEAEGAALEAPIAYPEVPGDPAAAASGRKAEGSRWNAVRHGCMAKLLFPSDLQEDISQHILMLARRYGVTDDYERLLIGQMGRVSAQLERMRQMLVIDLQRTMDRAVLCWDRDRGIYVDKLIKKLARDSGAARALARSKQGTEWLLFAWRGLADLLEFHGGWTEEEARLAVDLRGFQPELRAGYSKMLAEGTVAELEEIVKTAVKELEEALEHDLIALDDADQSLAAVGVPSEEDAQTKKLRKQEARLKLDYRRAQEELMAYRGQITGTATAAAAAAGGAPSSEPKPEAEAAEQPSTRPAPDPQPDPPPRPHTSKAAHNFLVRRSTHEQFELPATATTPKKTVWVLPPFPGGDPQPQPAAESGPEAETETETETGIETEIEPASARPHNAHAATNASREATANQRRERERVQRRAQEKKARKAARRRRR